MKIDLTEWRFLSGLEEVSQAAASRSMFITDVKEAAALLTAPQRRGQIQHVVSIGDPESQPPAGLGQKASRLRLEFFDAQKDSKYGVAPKMKDVDAIIAFAKRIQGLPGGLLIHCHAGISRSTATAITMLATWTPPGKESECVRRVFELRPIANPHHNMVRMADSALGRNGALLAALTQAKKLRHGSVL